MSAPSRGVMNRLRRVATRSPLSGVLLRPKVRKTLAGILATRFLIAARQTTEPGRFLADELAGRASSARRTGRRADLRADLRADSRVPRTYTLRSNGRQLPVRLPADLEAFYELFDRAEYAPPEPLETRLAADRVHRILDIGANCGMFAVWAADRWPKATITAFEPDPDSVAALRHTLAVSQAPIEIVAAAAATSPGTMRFTTGWGGGSHTAREGEDGIDVPTVDIFEHLRRADLAKIDIEGGEWPILADPRLASLHNLTIVMEYHRNGAPRLPAAEAASEALTLAGFTVGHIRPNEWGHGVLWAWKD